jgi:hypothetical protein
MDMEARRPGVVTFIGVVLFIEAFLNAVIAIAVFLFRDDRGVLSATGATADELLWVSLGAAIIAVLLFIVGTGILGGSRGARLFVAIVVALNMAAAVWTMFVYHQGGFLFSGLFTIGIGVFVLWALYGHERSEAFFERRTA